VITLKDYQERVLDSLREYFRGAARTYDPDSAFQHVTCRVYGEAMPYSPVSVEGLESRMPYGCLRVPTGGGKTLLACYAAGLALHDFMRADQPSYCGWCPVTSFSIRLPMRCAIRAIPIAARWNWNVARWKW